MLIIGGQGPRPFGGHGLAAGHESRRAHARRSPSGRISVPEGRRIPEYLRRWPSAPRTTGPARSGVPRDADRPALSTSYEEEKVRFPTNYRTEAGVAGDPTPHRSGPGLDHAGASIPCALVGSQLRWSRAAGVSGVRRAPSACRSYVNGLGRGSLPPGDPHFFSRTRKPAAARQADVVLIFGTPLDFRLGYGRDSHINPNAKLIHVDLDPRRARAQPLLHEVGIIGDTGLVMEQLTQAAKAEGYSKAHGEAVARRHAQARAGEPSTRSALSSNRTCDADQSAARVQGASPISVGEERDFHRRRRRLRPPPRRR